jgi:hypothetical protein
MDEHDDKRDGTEAAPDDSVEVWGRDVTREEFLEGRYGAASESEADDARAGGNLVTPAQVEPERLSEDVVDSGRPDSPEAGEYQPERDALSHGISRTQTHIAGTDVGRTPNAS